MKYQKYDNGAFMHNCFIKLRMDVTGCVFSQTPTELIPHLNGYAIIPFSEYCELTGREYNSTRIKEADEQLYGEQDG